MSIWAVIILGILAALIAFIVWGICSSDSDMEGY